VRLAFFSDVHSNLQALQACLEHLEQQGVDQRYCLGDIVGYNAQPAEVVDLLRAKGVVCIQGNHDWAATEGEPTGFNPFATQGVLYSRRALTPEHKKWLASLPRERAVQAEGEWVRMYHGSPRDALMEYVFPTSPTWLLDELALLAGSPTVVALGHTHLPMRIDRATLFLNPGSVGQPRDNDPRASYAILDTRGLATEFHRVAYDVEQAAREVREAGLPDFLWQRLLRGA
jgi:putative phosphoesterase